MYAEHMCVYICVSIYTYTLYAQAHTHMHIYHRSVMRFKEKNPQICPAGGMALCGPGNRCPPWNECCSRLAGEGHRASRSGIRAGWLPQDARLPELSVNFFSFKLFSPRSVSGVTCTPANKDGGTTRRRKLESFWSVGSPSLLISEARRILRET